MKWYKLNLNDCSSHHCLSSLIATNITHIKVFPSRSGKKYANTDSIHFFSKCSRHRRPHARAGINPNGSQMKSHREEERMKCEGFREDR